MLECLNQIKNEKWDCLTFFNSDNEKVEISGQTNYLITENYVIASITKLED